MISMGICILKKALVCFNCLKNYSKKLGFFFIGKLHMHPIDFESITSPAILTCERRKFNLSQDSLALGNRKLKIQFITFRLCLFQVKNPYKKYFTPDKVFG